MEGEQAVVPAANAEVRSWQHILAQDRPADMVLSPCGIPGHSIYQRNLSPNS
jgi:hypothetical protein